ncbi:hypothetical protein AB3N04_00680 (plasmid) [Alkalihalophilus sp. As8PL]|uniref:Uncharacterized protein n=1 Tax=Alkalihalophilus sp. As8PL TaxID=3237103 RepID=A0AB39BMV3_9BACI
MKLSSEDEKNNQSNLIKVNKNTSQEVMWIIHERYKTYKIQNKNGFFVLTVIKKKGCLTFFFPTLGDAKEFAKFKFNVKGSFKRIKE